MNSYPASSSFGFQAVIQLGLICLLAAVPAAHACLQGHRLAPPKPIAAEEYAKAAEAIKFVPTKLGSGQESNASLGMNELAPAIDFKREQYVRYVREFEARPAGAKRSFEDTTDYAVALIYLADYQKAIDVLVALEGKRPGIYTTAANLGTAYELTGDLEKALTWITTGIERNADSHHGTEWLHVGILRAKIALRADESWLKRQSVISEVGSHSDAEIVRAIEYQLGERLQFVRPLDAVVCDLFYQAALRVHGDTAPQKRMQFAQESLRFGPWREREIAALPKS